MPELNGLKQVLNDVSATGAPPPPADLPDTVRPQVDQVENSEKAEPSISVAVENGPNGEILTEDGGKDDAFVDCPDELNASSNNIVALEKTEQSKELNDGRKEADVHEYNNGALNVVNMNSQKECKDEKEFLLEEFTDIHRQLKALSSQQPLTNDNEEIGKHVSIHDAATECSKLVKNALDERLHMEGELRNLQSTLLMKDQEIENLQSKVSELTISQQNQNSTDLSNTMLQNVDDSINRTLASLIPTINGDKLVDESVTGKISFVEQNVSQLIGNYQYLLSETELLRQSLAEVSSDSSVQEDIWTTTAVARNVLIELKRKEVDFSQHISKLEEENKKVNEDIGKVRQELEQEKNRYANTKEKLSMAVSKGKALVQQKDTLKQSLAEKTSEIEKYLAEIKEKSRALEAADLVKEELVRTETVTASLQEALSQRDATLSKCEEILEQTSVNHEVESTDIVEKIRYLVDKKNALMDVMVEFNKLGDVLSSIDFPENVLSSDLESRVSWLVESLSVAKEEVDELQGEISRSSDVAREKIEGLTMSLLDETQEKNYIREELQGLTHKYQEIVEKESKLSMEKDRIVNLLLEASRISMEGQEFEFGSDIGLLVERCLIKIKEQSRASCESSSLGADAFEKMQAHLYIKDQELMLCEELLEEDTQIRSKVHTLVDELATVSQELQAMKDEKGALEKDLGRSDEKTALLREKLSLAVKKGKGLAQDRENLKKLMDEKVTEIENLKLELQQQESLVDDFKNQINKLSTNVETIPKLEADLALAKDEKEQLQQFLVESNNMIQRVMESIDGVVHPIDMTFEKPVDRVLWLVKYLNECQDTKALVEQELDNLKVECDSLSSKLSEAYKAKSSLEESLSTAESSISQLGEEKRELSEICATRRSLEDALSEAENKISVLINEKNDAQVSKTAVEKELEKVKEEVSTQTTRLAEAYRTINSLEDTLSHLETNVSLLSKENNDAQADRSNLEDEMKKLKEEAESQGSKFLDATSTIRSLEDNLSKLVAERKNVEEEISILKEEAESQASKFFDASSTIKSLEDNLSKLASEKKKAEEEISLLNSKLTACMEDLSGLGSSVENKSLEFSGHLNNLQLLLKDETLSSLLKQNFEVKFQSLRDMDLLLRDIKGHLVQKGSDSLLTSTSIEEDSFGDKFSADFENVANIEIDEDEDNVEGDSSFQSSFRKVVEGISSKNRILADRVQGCSNSMDEFIASLLQNLKAARDQVGYKSDQIKSLEQKVSDLETGRDKQEIEIASLENDIKVLSSACNVTARELEKEVENYQVELISVHELEKWTNLLSEVEKVRPAENLLLAVQKVCALTRQLEREKNQSADVIKLLENKMAESKATAENAIGERDLLQARLSKVENDLEVLESSHQEMSFKVEDCRTKEATLNDKEAEISFLRKSLMMKEKEAEDALLVASQVKSLYNKINDLEIPFAEFTMKDTEIYESDLLKKLVYVVDAVSLIRQQWNAVSQEKEKLQSTVEKQAHQIENLEKEIEEMGREKEDLEKLKSEMVEVELGLGNIIHKLGGNNLVGDQKLAGLTELFSILEKLVASTVLEYDGTKSRAEELGLKLHGSQKVVDELSAKIKLLEASCQLRSSSDGVEERSISEAPILPARSEITEVEDVRPLGKKAAVPPPFAPHARPPRKGSNDHLSINIDSESDRLIKVEENDEDKGKVFKSLNTSGLIPKQGKVFADRVDGFWLQI